MAATPAALAAVALPAQALRVLKSVALAGHAPRERNDVVMFRVSLTRLPSPLTEPVSSFMAFDAALLADPPVAFTHRLSSAGLVERHTKLLASLSQGSRKSVTARGIDGRL